MRIEEGIRQTGTSVQFGHPQSAGISLSIIENDPQAAETLSNWIRSAGGFRLVSYHSTTERALPVLSREKPAIVLIDIELPNRGAFNCVRGLRAALPETQLAMLLADENTDKIFEALASGATGYLLKETSRTELLAALRYLHAGGSPISRRIAKKVLESFESRSSESMANHAVEELSPREKRILRLLADGASYQQAADTFNIGLPIVSTYIRSIYEKLQVHLAEKFPAQ